MSYCQLCQLFGAWFLSDSLKAEIDFYDENLSEDGWNDDPAFVFKHHENDMQLCEA